MKDSEIDEIIDSRLDQLKKEFGRSVKFFKINDQTLNDAYNPIKSAT